MGRVQVMMTLWARWSISFVGYIPLTDGDLVIPILAQLPWHPFCRGRNIKIEAVSTNHSCIVNNCNSYLFLPIILSIMDTIEAIADPTDPGTLRPNHPPQPIIGDHYDLRDYPIFEPRINLPPGVAIDSTNSNSNAFNIWSLFFSTECLQNIVINTNSYANSKLHNQSNSRPFARSQSWFDTSLQELYTFLAILIYMGLHPEFDIESYWSLKELMPDHSKVTGHMSCNRWQAIWSNFHISPPSQNKETEYSKVNPASWINFMYKLLTTLIDWAALFSYPRATSTVLAPWTGRRCGWVHDPIHRT